MLGWSSLKRTPATTLFAQIRTRRWTSDSRRQDALAARVTALMQIPVGLNAHPNTVARWLTAPLPAKGRTRSEEKARVLASRLGRHTPAEFVLSGYV